MRYRKWADKAREAAPPNLPQEPVSVSVRAYFDIPKSASKGRRLFLGGNNHRQKPDADNIVKAVCDALFKRDECIAEMHVQKFWNDGYGARVEVEVL